MRIACILLVLAVWFVAVAALSLARQWAVVAPLLALGSLIETLSHNTAKE